MAVDDDDKKTYSLTESFSRKVFSKWEQAHKLTFSLVSVFNSVFTVLSTTALCIMTAVFLISLYWFSSYHVVHRYFKLNVCPVLNCPFCTLSMFAAVRAVV